MAKKRYRTGDRVTVATANKGLPVKGKRIVTATWAGRIVGPSLVGPDWWNVRSDSGRVYAVPEQEMRKPGKGQG
jgi:hypothetical protein